MHTDNYGSHRFGIYLTALFAIANSIVGNITQSDVAWIVSIVAGICAAGAALFTMREKIVSIRKMEKEIKNLDDLNNKSSKN